MCPCRVAICRRQIYSTSCRIDFLFALLIFYGYFYLYQVLELNHIKFEFEQYPKKAWCIDGEKLEKHPDNKYTITMSNNIPILIPNKNIKKLNI